MTSKEQLVAWLSDAHAMEQGIITTLKAHAEEAEGYPKIRTLIEEHLQATENHAEKIKECLQSLEADASIFKTGIAKAGALFSGFSTAIAQDILVKNTIAELATEHFEIACYTSIIAACHELGESSIADVCQEILEEEEAMAEVLTTQLPDITLLYLQELEEQIA